MGNLSVNQTGGVPIRSLIVRHDPRLSAPRSDPSPDARERLAPAVGDRCACSPTRGWWRRRVRHAVAVRPRGVVVCGGTVHDPWRCRARAPGQERRHGE